jgi:DNA-binding transcriptional LysR family regulator
MSRVDTFTGLSEFLAVAAHASFRLAAAELGVTPAAVSQAVRALERRLGVLLFVRTTRRVGLTEAGHALLSRLRPAVGEIGDAFRALGQLREQPAGLLRLSVPRMAVELVLEPVLPAFRRAYPEVSVEIDVNDKVVDLAAEGFDAGIRIGEYLARDMVAVRMTPDFRWSVLGAPSYFAAHGRPRTPEELVHHECIRYRFPTAGTLYRWEFARDGRKFSVDVRGGMVVNDSALMRALAVRGMGLVYTGDLAARAAMARGELEPVLQPYLPDAAALFLYFPVRSQTQPKLRAFIDLATGVLRGAPAKIAKAP